MMRLLLFSLFSFLLYTLVSSHPVTRARGVRIGRQMPEMKPEYPERDPPESDLSISPMNPNSEDSEDIEDWLEMVEKKCGFEVEMEDNIENVTPDDVRRILKSAAWTIEQVAKDFSQHGNDIKTLEANMAGQSLPDVVSAHIDILHKFGYLVESAGQKGICDFISMQMLLDRMQFMGNDGFGESRCNNAYGLVFRPDEKVRKQNKLDWIRNFGDAIRKDMYCIVDDINALSKRMTSLKDLAESNRKPSLRDIYIGLSTIMADEGILEDEIKHFHKAIKVVGKALKDVDLQALQVNEIDAQVNSIKRLLSTI